MAQEQWKCLIIGQEPGISDTAKLLNSSFVPTKVLKYKDGCESQVMQMVAGGNLEVIVVFCSDLPGDGVDFLRIIDKKIQSKVPTHILVDESAKKALKQLKIFCTEETQTFSVTPFFAASVIKRRWFPTDSSARTSSSRVVHRSTGAMSVEASATPEVSSVVSKPVAISEVSKTPKATTPKVALVVRTPVSKPSPATVPTSVSVPVAIPSIHNKADLQNTLGQFLKGVQRNALLSKEPSAMSIVGKHGTIVELDPRRVRRLPDNPRQATNPGFSDVSIQSLGQNITTMGQLEEVLVCPIVGDPDYDAQIVDGERRHRATLWAGLMLRASVREDITAEMAKEMYLLSIVRNDDKEPHTTFDFMKMVVRLRGPEFKLTQADVASILSCSGGLISQYESLSKLHPEVQQMLSGGTRGVSVENVGRQKERKGPLTLQLGLLLSDVPLEKQPAVADHLLQENMNHEHARRYIRSVRRDLGLNVSGKRNRSSSQFQSFSALVNRNSNLFGEYLDMSSAEITQMMTNRTMSEKKEIVASLRELSKSLLDLVAKIEK